VDAYRTVGRISGLWSDKGELNIATWDGFPAGEKFEGPLFVFIDKLAVPLFMASLRRRSASAVTILFDDIDTRARAAALVGLELFIMQATPQAAQQTARKARQKTRDGAERFDDLASLTELTGYCATLRQGPESETLEGEITDFFDNGANPLFEVTFRGTQIYIPATLEFIKSIDPKARHIVFSLPEGLLELYI